MNVLDRLLVKLYRRARSLDDKARYDQYRRIHDVHPTFKFNGPGILLSDEGRVSLGAHSYVGMHSLLLAKPGADVIVGEHTSISHFFVAYTKNVSALQDMSMPEEEWDTRLGSVRIGSYCWIGFRVLVVEGVTIGDNVVVGAHSVVTKDLPANGIYAGVPAKLIKEKQPVRAPRVSGLVQPATVTQGKNAP